MSRKHSLLVWVVIGLAISVRVSVTVLLLLFWKGLRPVPASVVTDVAVAESNPKELEPAIAVPAEKDFSASNVVSVVLGEELEEDGVRHLAKEADGRTTLTNLDGVACRRLDRKPRSFGYLYFAIAPTFKAPELDAARIEIEYLVQHSGVLRLQFDAMEPDRHHPYKTADPVNERMVSLGDGRGYMRLRASNAWQTATFNATNGYFNNSENGGADFRLEVTPAEIYVRRVTVTRVDGPATR